MNPLVLPDPNGLGTLGDHDSQLLVPYEARSLDRPLVCVERQFHAGLPASVTVPDKAVSGTWVESGLTSTASAR